MAQNRNMVTVQHIWPDGEVFNVQIVARNAYPDALDQAKRVALDAFNEGIATVETTCRLVVEEGGD